MLSINVLGTSTVVDEATGHIQNLSSRSTALLGLLIANAGRPQQRATIAGLFWPDSGDAQALTNLRRELHQLRSVLGDDDSLEVTTTHLCWHDRGRHRVDLSLFSDEASAALAAGSAPMVVQHGTRALEEYRGPFLAGIDAEWLEPVRAQLERRCTAVCTAIERAASRTGRYDVAIAAVRRQLELEHYDEAAHRRLMELQAESGDRAAAISTYHRLAGLLERELGIEPDPRTRSLFSRLIGSATPAPGPSPGQAGKTLETAPLVGRRQELELMLSAWRSAADGRSAVLAISGEPGVGKTRLLAELLTHVRGQGAIVATSRCFDTSGRLSLSPVADWLRARELASARSLLDDVWRSEVDRLAPSRSEGPSAVPPSPPHSQDAWQRHRFFEGLARAVMAPARPLLLVIDNAHWSDPDTLSFARFLLNIAADVPLLLAVTLRPPTSGVDTSVAQWLAGLNDEGLLTEISLAPLDAEGTAELATALTGARLDTDEQRTLHGATGGFPLYVVEAARSSLSLQVGSPATTSPHWSAILGKRIQQTSPAAREVAGLAAAFGRDFTIPLLVEAGDLTPEAVVAGVDELWRQRILTDTGSGYDFTHDLLRDAAYQAVSPTRQWLLHRRLAQALELMWIGHTDAVASQLAVQYRRAGSTERALQYYRQAAQATASVFAHEQAVELLTSAQELVLSLPASRDRNEQELELLELMIPPLNAQYGYASQLLCDACERALELSEELGYTPNSVNALVGLWASRFVQGRTDDCYDIAVRAVARVHPGDERYAQAHFSLAAGALHKGDPLLADKEFRIAVESMQEEALTFGTRARVHTMAWWAHAAWTVGDVDRAAELAQTAAEEATAFGHRYSQVVGLAYQAVTLQLLGRVEECESVAREVRELCNRYQFTYYGDWGRILEGWAMGDDAGVRLMRAGLDNFAKMGARARLPYWTSLLADRLNDPERAGSLLDAGIAECDRSGDRWWLPELLRRRAELLDGTERRAMLDDALGAATKQHSSLMEQRIRGSIEKRSRRTVARI